MGTTPQATAQAAGAGETALATPGNPLPRAVVRRGAYQLLDGTWRFALDPDDRGLAEAWHHAPLRGGTAEWPGSIESQVEAAGQGGARPPGEVVAWYEREFDVPAEWLAAPEAVVQVTFGACGYETRVWLNGAPLRTIEGEEAHLGEYTSFSFELPPERLAPAGTPNRLTVRVADSLDPDRPRGKQESHVYKRGGIWYQATSGPVRSVWLEPVERNRLRSRLGVTSHLDDRLLDVQVTARVHDAGVYRLRLAVSDPGDDGRVLGEAELALPLAAGETRQHVAVPVPGARPWGVGAPVLYRLVAELTGPGGYTSRIESRVGLRAVAAHGRGFYLNGARLYLDGILYQPAGATYEQMRRHLFAVRDLGCNLVRVHIAGIDPRIYALADELGMLVWVEVPSPHRPTPESRANHWAELQRLLVQVGAHPSVVIVSLYNEDWGAEDIADPGPAGEETRAYVRRAYAHLRVQYPQFLVVDNDGWQHVSTQGRLQSDLLTVHSYQTEQARWEDVLDRLVRGDHDGVAAKPLVVGDPYYYAGQAPLVVSEWGGFGFDMYGGPARLDDRADRIRAFKRALRARDLAGDVYTQATSVEGETNGIIDAATGALLVPAGLLASPAPDDGTPGQDGRPAPAISSAAASS